MDKYFLFIIENIEYVMLGVFLFTFTNQLFYYIFFYTRIIPFPEKPQRASKTPVSVVICAKNEENNLREYLPKVLEQKYPVYEVIIVDDGSEDNTWEVIAEYKQKYSNLRTTFIHKDVKFTHGKKLALTVGLKAATYETIVLIDADCFPASSDWLEGLMRNYSLPQKKIVIAYGGVIKEKGLLNLLIRVDVLYNALQYLTFAKAGIPFMGVGRNLSYKKELFFNNKGFAKHSHIFSGDDDLFVNEVATKENAIVEIHPDNHTYTKGERSFNAWVRQKRRHITTGTSYKLWHKFLLGHELSTRVMFYFTFIWLIVMSPLWIWILGIFGVRFIIQTVVLAFAGVRLRDKNVLLLVHIYDIFMPFFNFVMILLNLISRKKFQ